MISAWETLHPRARRWLLFTVVTLVYFALRATTDIVWNDTVVLAMLRYDGLGLDPHWRLDSVLSTFGLDSPDQPYRPLADLLIKVCFRLFGLGPLDIRIWIAVFAAVIGGTGVAVYSVAARLLKSETWALVATLLFLCGPGFLTAAWVVLAGIQALVPLGFCLGLLLYWRATETQGRWRALNLFGLGAIFLLGPWYREFFGILPLLVIFEEVRRRRRPTAITALAALGFLHAIFPTALAKLLLLPELPLLPTFEMGLLAGQLGQPGSFGALARILEQLQGFSRADLVSLQFLVLFPPSLVGLAYLGFVARAVAGLPSVLATRRDADSRRGRLSAIAKTTPATLALFVLLPAIAATWALTSTLGDRWTVEVWGALGLVLFGASVDALLGVWLFLTLVPFFKIFTEIVHLAYATVPASIILAAGVRHAWQALADGRSRMLRAARGALAILIALLVSDQALNLYGVWHVMRSVTDGMKGVAATLEARIPRGSVIVSNVLHAFDIRLFAENWFDARFTTVAGISPRWITDRPEQLAALLALHPGQVYFLDVSQPYLPSYEAYFGHKFLRLRTVDVEDMGSLHVTAAVYPLLDPLQNIVPRPLVPFLGPPDLINDFYRGPSLSGQPFVREVFAEYRLYKVTSTTVRP